MAQRLPVRPRSGRSLLKNSGIFFLTPEMRVDEVKLSLEEKMKRVLQKMTSEPIEEKKKTVSQELQPLLKEWMQRMRPDLPDETVSQELNKILPSE